MISYSINRQVKNKPHKNQMHIFNNKFERVQGTMEDLMKEVQQGHAFCIADLEENKSGFCHRLTDNFLSCEMIAVDIDNSFEDIITNDDGSWDIEDEEGNTIESGIDEKAIGKSYRYNFKLDGEDYWSLENIQNHSFVKNYASFIYTSASHREDWHRYRIIFKLPQKILDPKRISQILKWVQKMFDPASDKNCVASVQSFYGSEGCKTIWIGNECINETIINNIAVEDVGVRKEEYKVKFNRNEDTKIQEHEVAAMLSCINKQGEYLDWVRIISAVASEFDEETTIRLIEQWSPGTEGEVKQKYDNRLKDVSIGTLIYFAKQGGYEPPQHWYKSKEKRTTPSRTELREFLQKYALWRRNVMKNKIIEYKPYLTDEWIQVETEHINSLLEVIEELTNFKVNKTLLEEVIDTTNLSENFHPLQSYFADLRWDGNDRFKELSEVLEPTIKYISSDNDITQKDIDLFYDYAKKLFGLWFRSAYACGVYGSPNELMIILQGKQGIGKTRFVKAIYPPGLDNSYFYAGGIVDNKDTLSRLSKKFFYVDDEMEGMKKTDINFFKSLLSQSQVTLREVYGKRDSTTNRTASFLGSVNKDEFLKDEENRRFPVLAIKSVDFKKLSEIDIQMLWAQAKEEYESGLYPNYADADMRNAINKFNEKHYMQNDVSYYIQQYIGKPQKSDSKVSCQTLNATQIRDHIIQAHKASTDITLSNSSLNIQWVKQELARLNYQSVNHHGSILWKVKISPVESYKKIDEDYFPGRILTPGRVN